MLHIIKSKYIGSVLTDPPIESRKPKNQYIENMSRFTQIWGHFLIWSSGGILDGGKLNYNGRGTTTTTPIATLYF